MLPKNLSLIQEVDEDKTMSIIPRQQLPRDKTFDAEKDF